MISKPIKIASFIAVFLSNINLINAQLPQSCISAKSLWTSIDCFKIGTIETQTVRKEMMQGDTIINGITYKKMYQDNSASFNWATAKYVCAVREQNQQVYYVTPDGLPERMLYDFSKNNIGDSIEVVGLGLNYPNAIKLRIDNITTTNFNGINRKTYHFNANGSYHTDEKWYEGIGSSFGFLTPFLSVSDNIFTLKCNAKNDTLVYLLNNISNFLCGGIEPFNSCEYTHNATSIGISNKLRIDLYPNPVANRLLLSEFKNNIRYAIFNNIGQIVFNGIYKNTGIDVTGLNAGVYYLQINNDGNIGREKFVK